MYWFGLSRRGVVGEEREGKEGEVIVLGLWIRYLTPSLWEKLCEVQIAVENAFPKLT